MFIWKILNQALPGREAIFRRTGKGELICKNCGEDVETAEHILFHCRRAQLIWKMAPIHWDGLVQYTRNFKDWWLGLLEAKDRKDGTDHITLTIGILWQIWKARNEFEFEDKDRHLMEAVRKAIKDWEEYNQSQQAANQMSISETGTADEQVKRLVVEDDSLNICVEVGQHKEGQNMGIGIMAENNRNQILAAWKMKERSTGDMELDYLQAIKLALSKAKEQRWQLIEIQTSCTRALNRIRKQATSNISIAVQVEDIKDVSSLFRTCSFESPDCGLKMKSKRLCELGIDIELDEEYLDPQCLSTLVV